MSDTVTRPEDLEPQTMRFYRGALAALRKADVPVLVGGAYALNHYAGIVRHTKDFDLFTRPADAPRVLATLARIGCRTEITFEHWLGKAFRGDDFVDVIFNSGNGLCPVDDGWFVHAAAGTVFGQKVGLCPAEEMIWQKSFIMERERFDGADVNHLLRAHGSRLDWARLVSRFGANWRVLLSHLVLFGFVYPAERDKVPAAVLEELTARLQVEVRAGVADEHLCRGTVLSRGQYLTDTGPWGYRDARLPPEGRMTEEQVTHWTAAIGR
jgi:hypothetical protein